jgi:hypothetical protein
MAFITDNMGIEGSIGNMSAYRMRGVDKMVVRTKGGATKAKIKTDANFAKTRQINSEFGGCAKMAKAIRMAIEPIAHLADYNFTPSLIAMAKKMQLQDTLHPRGERSIQLSTFRYLLDGFGLNKRNGFDTIIKHSIRPRLDRTMGNAIIEVPDLIPNMNLSLFWPHPYYRLVLSIGLVTDLAYGNGGYEKQSNTQTVFAESLHSAWIPVQQTQKAEEVVLQLKNLPPITDQQTLVVAAGIEMGSPKFSAEIEHVKYAGAGKILLVG